MSSDNAIALKKKAKIEIIPGEHFAYRMIQHQLPLGGIGALQSQLCQERIGVRVAVLTNNVILVAERVKDDVAVLVTGWNASLAQIEAIENNDAISVRLSKGRSEDMIVRAS